MSLQDFLVPWRRPSMEKAAGRSDSWLRVASLQRDMNRLFEDIWGTRFPSSFGGEGREEGVFDRFIPNVEVKESDGAIGVTAELPGLDEKDIEVLLANDNQTLTIRGEKKVAKDEKGESYYQCERSYGAFQRQLSLPVPVKADSVKAKMKHGVLEIEMAKADEKSRGAHPIEVKHA